MNLIVLALLPAIMLGIWIYQQDKVEKEPKELLAKIFIFGIISVFPVMFLELLLCEILGRFVEEGTWLYVVVEWMVCIALVEESFKMLATKLSAWKDRAFNYKFDAIVYCVISSLGFAATENILYVVQRGFGTAIARAVMSVPGHAVFGLVMGYFFGIAKEAEVVGNKKICRQYKRYSIIIPTIIHGLYDIAASLNNGYIFWVLVAFLVMVDIWAFRFVKRLSKEDYQLL